MFQDLDNTLKTMLDDPAMKSPPVVPPLTELFNADISFITPDKTFPPALTQPTVNLFLYDVKENRELRDLTPIIEKVGSTFTRRPPPVRVDCSYIVTAWSNAVGAAQVLEEHRLLAQSLLWLSRFSIIPPNYLQGSLLTQLYPPPMWVAQLDPNKNAGEFWDALAIPPRPAFYLTVTVAMELSLLETGPLVTTRTTNTEVGAGMTGDAWVQIGGRILTAGGQGIPGALVDITDAGLQTISDGDGRYTFPRVPVGAHTVRIVAVGFKPKTQPLTVPGLPEDYNVTLIPL